MSIHPDYKVHAKIVLVARTVDDKDELFSIIGTGNPNEDTATTYSDSILFTANKEICTEVNNVFKMIDKRMSFPIFNQLLVSPINLRNRLTSLIDNEINNAKNGKPAKITLKLNNLSDRYFVDKLYEVAEAGVELNLIVRGICTLNPDIIAKTAKVKAISIVDKFLEHSRFYVFENNGNPLYFMGSADFVKGKIDERIEVVVPVLDTKIKKEIQDILDIQLSDNTHSRYISLSKSNEYYTNNNKPIRSQEEIAKYLRKMRG
jgi:polyphosphate kinase